jgi:hypothetical protein
MKKRSIARINTIGFIALICLLALFIEKDDTSIAGWGAGSSGSKCDNSSPTTTIFTRPDTDTTDNVKCITAYADSHYSGESMRQCTDGSQSREFLNDEFSSFKLDDGAALKVCDYSDGTGGCQTYYESVNWIGDHFNDRVSYMQLSTYSPDNFKVIFASDPQLFWRECFTLKGCANDGGTTEEVGTKTNRNHVASMNALQKLHGFDLTGVIMNGDLTAYGHANEFEAYWQFYEVDLQMNLWPGLGNHDYQGNVDDCHENHCAMRMVNYMADKVDQLNATGFDWSVSSYYDFPSNRKKHQGSLAYSWNIGDVHFIQLQNFPLYHTSFDAWHWGGADLHHYDIRASIPWLIEALKSATAQNKKIVLNFHMAGYSQGADNQTDWWMFGGPFKEALEKHGQHVVAIMVGHNHHLIDKRAEFVVSHRTIPVFWNGSAIYQRYLLASFEGDSMKIEVVDSSGGKDYSLGSPTHYDISLPNTAPRR